MSAGLCRSVVYCVKLGLPGMLRQQSPGRYAGTRRDTAPGRAGRRRERAGTRRDAPDAGRSASDSACPLRMTNPP